VSTAANPLAARGIATSVALDPARPLHVRHGVRAFPLPGDGEAAA
jgi:hypothetical protein